jgi:hypothetical protein
MPLWEGSGVRCRPPLVNTVEALEASMKELRSAVDQPSEGE